MGDLKLVYHGGSIPGISTYIYWLPGTDLGIVTLSNTDAVYFQEFAIIYRIIEDYLSLKKTHSERVLQLLDETSVKAEIKTPAASNESTDSQWLLPLEAYAGKYADPGYPTLTLCAPSSTSAECQDVLKSFAHFENVTATDTLYVIFPSLWFSHARLKRRERGTFGLSGTFLFPHGYGKDTTPFELGEPGAEATVEFTLGLGERRQIVAIGMGIRGLVGETTNLERAGGPMEKTSEVYFEKVWS